MSDISAQTSSKAPVPTKVQIWESEAGWGSKIDEVKTFHSREEAIKFVKDYNNKYNPILDPAPSWYMYARLEDDNSYEIMR